MKIFLKFVWRSLPVNLKDFLRPKIVFLLKFFPTVFGRQYLTHPIGKVSVPYFTKSALKRSFSQQGEDLILDRVLTSVLRKDVFKPHTYVDVGAYDAIDHSVTYLLYLRGWNGVVLTLLYPRKNRLKDGVREMFLLTLLWEMKMA